MKLNKPELIRLLDLADRLISVIQLPLFPSKHSRKDFTNHQLFKLLMVKTRVCVRIIGVSRNI